MDSTKDFQPKEINDIYSHIETFKNFYLTSNKKPFFYLFKTILGLLASIKLTKHSHYGIPLLTGFIVRTFMIVHDCCHNSFFKITEKEHNDGKRGYNKIFAQILEPFVGVTEYNWRTTHSYHHKIHGNLNLYDYSKTVITVEKYNSLPIYQKILYRFFREPILFFIWVPIYNFWITHLLKFYKLNSFQYVVKYILKINLIYKYGKIKLLKRYLFASWLASSIGTMLFHLQHQVNIGYWKRYDENDKLSWEIAQLQGASMLDIPWFIKWLTFGIEYHHIHHLSPRIPSYNLQSCHEKGLNNFSKITIVNHKQALRSLFHVLYDESKYRYISFPFHKKLGLEY